MKRCPKCGAANRKYATTCLRCGYNFNYNNTESTHKLPNKKYQRCWRCKRYFSADADKCPYCGANSDNRYTDNYCVHCGKHVTRFNLLHRQSPDSQGDMTYFICPYCHSKQGWHCPTCHRYNDIKQLKGEYPTWSKNYNTNGLLCNHCFRFVNNYCPKCKIPVALSYNYCPHCGFNLKHINTKSSVSSLFFTRHPYLLVAITIIMGWILIISVLNEDLYPAKYNNSIISGCMLLSIGLVLVTTITRHLCPITMEFITIGIGYFMLKSMGLNLSGNTGNIAWDITIYFSATLIFIVVCRMLLIMDSFIAYHDIGLIHEFIRYLRS